MPLSIGISGTRIELLNREANRVAAVQTAASAKQLKSLVKTKQKLSSHFNIAQVNAIKISR